MEVAKSYVENAAAFFSWFHTRFCAQCTQGDVFAINHAIHANGKWGGNSLAMI